MKNKSLVLFVCLVLMIFGFTTAFAGDTETVTTITVRPGSLLAEYEAVKQICDIAAIRLHSLPDGYGAFVLSLDDVDALQSLFKLEENGVYMKSGIFGETPLYFSWEDLQAFYMKQMEANPDIQAMNGAFNMGMMQSMMDGSVTDEQALEMMGVDEELMDFIGDIAAKQIVETGAFALDGSDIANHKTTTILTKEDMARAIDLPIVRKQLLEQLQMSSPDLTEEEIDHEIDATLEGIKQAIAEGNLTITSALYTADEAFDAFELVISGTDGSSGSIGQIGMSITVTKTTIETAKFYQLSVKLFEANQEFLNQSGSLYVSDEYIFGKYTVYSMPNEIVFEAAFNCDTSLPAHSAAELLLTVYDSYNGGAESVLIMFDQSKDENVTDTAIDVFIGGIVDEIKASLTTTDLISLKFHTVTQPDSGYFSALQNATPDTSAQLLQMTEEDLEEYMLGMEQGLMMTILTVIDNLPPEISDTLMQGMGAI